MTMTSKLDQLHTAIATGVAEVPADILLLSGGVDSSLIAAMMAEQTQKPPVAITVSLDASPAEACPVHGANLAVPCNSDHDASKEVARWLDLRWQPIRVPSDVALDALVDLCLQMQSFDLGNLNNIPLYLGLLRATRVGANRIATGDDADSLFGGYAFLRKHADWPTYLAQRIPTIRPPFTDIAPLSSATPVFPMLHPAVLDAATQFTRAEVFDDIPATKRPSPPSFVDQFDASLASAASRPWGKAPIRRLAERLLPEEIAWRPKTDLEFGSGMCALEPELASVVDPDTRERLDRTGIRFFNDAHRGLYLRWVDAGGRIPQPDSGSYPCVSCGGAVTNGWQHCLTCGQYPADANS